MVVIGMIKNKNKRVVKCNSYLRGKNEMSFLLYFRFGKQLLRSSPFVLKSGLTYEVI